MIPKESECVNGWLHRFQLTEQYFEGVWETCEICGQRQFFRIVEGTIDNEEYLKYHIRQALPKEHPLFYREYEYENEVLKDFIYD